MHVQLCALVLAAAQVVNVAALYTPNTHELFGRQTAAQSMLRVRRWFSSFCFLDKELTEYVPQTVRASEGPARTTSARSVSDLSTRSCTTVLSYL